MTDKQIIIDGKTIGCPCYIDRPLYRYDKACLVQSQSFTEQQREEKPILRCDEIKNCPIKENYKQLKCKEQECERWKSNFNGKVSAIKELLKQLDQLKGKNEELKKTIMYKCPQCGEEYLSPIGASLYEENEKLKQTLTEIKEIAENAYCLTNGTNKDMANFAKQILQIIGNVYENPELLEVEND